MSIRDHSPLERCQECGAVTVVLVYEEGLDENGDRYKALWRETIEHTRKDCAAMVALAREEWPTLW